LLKAHFSPLQKTWSATEENMGLQCVCVVYMCARMCMFVYVCLSVVWRVLQHGCSFWSVDRGFITPEPRAFHTLDPSRVPADVLPASTLPPCAYPPTPAAAQPTLKYATVCVPTLQSPCCCAARSQKKQSRVRQRVCAWRQGCRSLVRGSHGTRTARAGQGLAGCGVHTCVCE